MDNPRLSYTYKIGLTVDSAKSNIALDLAKKPYVATIGVFTSLPKPVDANQANGIGGSIGADIPSAAAAGIIIYKFPYDPATILVLGASLDAQTRTSQARVGFMPAETKIDQNAATKFMNDPRFLHNARKQFAAHSNPDGTGPFYLTVTGSTTGLPPIVSATFTIVKTY